MGKGSPWRNPEHGNDVGSSVRKRKRGRKMRRKMRRKRTKKRKKKKSRMCVFVTVDVAHTQYPERTPCAPGWTDIHLPGGYRLSHRTVPMLPESRHGWEWQEEIA
jgi:hypothetical protein